MKVLWFSNTPTNGDSVLNDGIQTGGWLKALDIGIQNKIELHIAFYYPKFREPFKYLNTHYYPIGNKNWKQKLVWDALTKKVVDEEDCEKYLKIIKQVQPDIIHIHGTENPFACLIPYTNVPVVVSIQGNITVINKKYFSGLEKKFSSIFTPTLNLKKIIFKRDFLTSYHLLKKMEIRELKNMKNVEYVIGRTDWDRRITSVMSNVKRYFHSDEMLRGVFLKTEWTNYNIKDNTIIIHSTSGNNYYKGLETIIEAANILSNKQISFKWQIAGVNLNDDIVKVILRKLGKENCPLDKLEFLGSLNEIELANKLQEANMFVMASHIENSPNNLCEAMILGLPCIATYAGGTSSLILDGLEGILIQDGDPWSLAGAVLEFKNYYPKAIELGRNARNRALKRHDENRIITQVLNIYQEISKLKTNSNES
jgi:glycosyltransferase involved in cell wall biosynthesis